MSLIKATIASVVSSWMLKRNIQETTTVKDEKEQVVANLEKNILQLQQQLMEIKLEVKQVTEKNTELEVELAELKLKEMVRNNTFQINIITQ